MAKGREDIDWMRLALAEAEKGRGAVEPNPMVGAVVVRDDRAIGFGHHGRERLLLDCWLIVDESY